MLQDDRSGSELFRELLRVFPGAVVEDYYKGGRWEVENLLIDAELMERHREEAGAPEPPSLEEIPEPVLPDAVLPPWQQRTVPPAPSRLPVPGPPRTPAPGPPPAAPGPPRTPAPDSAKRKPENGFDRGPSKQARTEPSGVGSTYARPQPKVPARPATTNHSDSRRAVPRPSQNPNLSLGSRDTARENTRSSARPSREKPNSRQTKEKADDKDTKPGDLISLLLF